MVATWIQAIGSAGSLLAFAAWVGIAVLNHKTDHEMRFEQQAQGVAAWVDKGELHDSEDAYVLCIVNGADSPVYDVEVSLPGLAREDEPHLVNLQLVPPRTTRAVSTPTAVRDKSWEEIYASGVAPDLRFRDSSGRHWHRGDDGILTET